MKYRLFDYAPTGMCVIDRNFTVIFWNECLEDWTGIPRAATLGKDVRQFCPRFANEYYTQRIKSVFADSAPVVFSSQLHKNLFPAILYNGEPQIQHVKLTILPSDETENVHALFSIEDVSELNQRITDYRREQLRARSEIERRKAIEQQLRASIEEKEFLIKEIHHRIKNNMAMVAGLIGLQEDLVHDDRDKAILLELKGKVHSISLVHEKLYKGIDLKSIDFQEYLAELIPLLIDSVSSNDTSVNVEQHIAAVDITIDTAIPITLLITELVINALKYAFPNGRIGTLSIQFYEHDNEFYILSIKDNGIGLPEDIDLSSTESLGLSLVQSFATQLKANLSVNRSAGTEFRLHIPRTSLYA